MITIIRARNLILAASLTLCAAGLAYLWLDNRWLKGGRLWLDDVEVEL